MNLSRLTRLVVLIGLALTLAAPSVSAQPAPRPAAAATVVWISIDGLRHDYLDRFKPPVLTRLAKEGAFTHQQRPVFPSLTFPNHISQVTGTRVDRHGIVMNEFYDAKLRQAFKFPERPDLLRSEPIWVTAKRQGVRTAVLGWPVSYNQAGAFKSDYVDTTFAKGETDAARLGRVLVTLKDDRAESPLRLVLTYMSRVDTVGHRDGPESDAVGKALLDTDAVVGSFVESLAAWFKTNRPGEELVVLITTDHGMAPLHTLVSLERLLGADLSAKARLVLGGPIACVALDDVPEADRVARARAIVEKLKGIDHLRAWPAAEVPAGLYFADPDRIGDVVALLDPGYAFTASRSATTMPSTAIRQGQHGYDPAATDDLLGTAIVWRSGKPLGGTDLGPVDNTQWHATVCQLLGIEPATGADVRAVRVR